MIRGRRNVRGFPPPSPPSLAAVGRRRPEEEEDEEGGGNIYERIAYYFHLRYPIASTAFILYIPIFAL